MQEFEAWWKRRSKGETAVYTVTCIAFIFWGGIEIGRALYQATH